MANLDKDDAYELSAEDSAEIPTEWQGGPAYELETAARCPHCRNHIQSVRVIRLKRSQVAFMSTLPRGGRALACPACEGILSVELAAL